MKRSVRDISASAADRFSYIIVYAPDFPSEDQTNADQQCGRLLDDLRELESRAAETPKKQWLLLTLTEVEQARLAFREGDVSAASSLLQSAEGHFKAYLSGKRAKASFIAGPDGTIEQT